MSADVQAIVRDPSRQEERWWRFRAPRAVLETDRLSEVRGLLDSVADGCSRGLYAVGYVGYEAAPAFDPALAARTESPLPLAWFGLFEEPERLAALPPANGSGAAQPPEWSPTWTAAEHAAAVRRVQREIAAGTTYQVNLTYRLRAPYGDDPRHLFDRLWRAQRTRYATYLDTGRHVIASASPELFFARRRERILCRPMKGTGGRGRFAEEDRAASAALAGSAKERAENVMIVDMVRNDLGRIARTGSVSATRLFAIETYDTVLQLVSDVEATSDASLSDLFAALFPAASITGAPKVRTTEHIRALEGSPRGIYTGALGTVRPDGDADFSVAIRTVHIDRERGTAEYGTGGGITWDSAIEGEWNETKTKALILAPPAADFELLETLRWEPQAGYRLLDRHLSRLVDSATYFGRVLDRNVVRDALTRFASTLEPDGRAQVVRLVVDRGGSVSLESRRLEEASQWRVGLARHPVDSTDRFLFHKTTRRRVYERALSTALGCDDVVLWNERGEVTESTRANVVAVLDGVAYTPPLTCGLLAGTERQCRLEDGRLIERPLALAELATADEIYLINSVRGRIAIETKRLQKDLVGETLPSASA